MLRTKWAAAAALVAVACCVGWAHAGLFPWIPEPVNLGAPSGSRTYDDIEGDPLDPDIVYTTAIGVDEIHKMRLDRSGGMITGATLLATIDGPNSEYVKCLGVLTTDRVYGAAEEYPKNHGNNDDDGGVYRYDFAGGGGTLTGVADLTGVRNDGGSDFDPEGIAVDPQGSLLYVMTDDATDQDVAQYTINPDGSLSATPNWVATVHAGESNARTGSIAPWGDLLTVTGEGATTNVWMVSAAGGVSNPFGGPLTGFSSDGPRDVLFYGDALYVADENGTIYGYAWNGGSPSSTPSGSWDLRAMLGENVYIGGLALTPRGELLVSIRQAGGADGRNLAFNIPEPGSLSLLALGLAGFLARRRR